MKILENQGITLIVLIITIIILLVLAGITIEALTGDNSLIKQTEEAKENAEIANEKELIETATIQTMGKDKYGNVTVEGLQSELEDEATVEKIRKKIVVTINDSKRTYYVDNNGNVFEYIYSELSKMESGNDFYTRISEYRTQILNVKVIDNLNIPGNAYQSFDVSANQDGSVMAGLIQNEENKDYYDLYIGGNDGVKATGSCQNIFANLENCLTIDLEHFYTDDTKNFDYMFMNCRKLTYINLENLNTANATSMNAMFNNCNSISEINVTNFETSNVVDMGGMFGGCNKLEKIDLSNFDTKKVTAMNSMFNNCYELETLDLSKFETSKLQRTDYMFLNCNKLKTIYVGDGWDNNNITQSTDMFRNCLSLSGAISYDYTKTDIAYANYSTGYFTYKMVSSN